MSRQLIVNADDFNTDRERDAGIIRAAKEGIVTSTTVISNLPWNDSSLSELKETFGRNIGIHLNLTKGYPLVKGLRSLVGENGCFMEKKKFWSRAFFCRIDLSEVEKEFAAQINNMKEAGISPDHIDGNNHVHVFPGLPEIVARLAQRFGITRVRLPMENCFVYNLCCFRVTAKKIFLCMLSLKAKKVFKRTGLLFADHFSGIQYPIMSNMESLLCFLRTLPEGLTELMCHPGYRSQYGGKFSNNMRKKELIVLTHPSVVNEIKKCRIKLTSFSDIQL